MLPLSWCSCRPARRLRDRHQRFGDPNPNAGFQAKFVPLGGIMPFPNDLYFSGSTTGTLNIPGSATVPQNAPLLALNHLDGFGTESDINIYFMRRWTRPPSRTTYSCSR